jgi:gliding motility-associated-like protein
VNPSADANWTTPSSLCSSSPPINLDLQITGTTGGTWSGTGVSGNTFDPSFGNQSVTYTVGSGACQQTLTQTITVISAVDPNWTNPSPLCASSGTFNLNPQITGTTGGTWSGTGVTGNTFNLSSGTQAITYTIGSGVCQQTLTQTITVNPDVDSSWTNPSPLCASSVTFNLNPQITGTTGGTWSGTGVTGNIFNLSSGTHAITYTVGAVACQESYTQTITVLPDVNPNWTSPTGICQDETSFDLTTTITGTTGGTWSGTGITGNMFDPNVGTQSITYTVGTAPCLESETHQIIISPIPTVSVQAQSLNLCEGESINLFATSPNAGNNAQYSWTGPNGASSSLQNPSFNNADTTNTGYYSAQVTSSVGCISEPDSVLVTIFPKPQISFTGINLEGCPTLCPTIISTSTSGSTSAITNYVWTLSNGNTYSGQSFTDCFENNGSSDMSLSVTLQATTNHNCNNQATTINFINVYHHPTAAFQYNPTTLDVMHSQVNFTNLSSNATSYYWHFEGQNSSVETNPTVIFPEIAQSYEVFLVASTDKGCVDTARTTITINDLVIFYIPNTFTPDGDEFNQMFKPIITSGIDPYSYALSIYDRWGELIFESHDIQIGWDGTYQGKICKEGAYIWKISFKETSSDKKQVHQGHLNLLK